MQKKRDNRDHKHKEGEENETDPGSKKRKVVEETPKIDLASKYFLVYAIVHTK